MKNKFVRLIATAILQLSFLNAGFAQAPDLGAVTNSVLFTTTGAMGNTGISDIVGNIGTNNGAITGFEAPTTMVGNIDSGNSTTVQCSADLLAAYNQLFNTAPTSTTHTPAYGTETLFAGVYAIAAAGSIAGDLTLDAQGDPNAIFIFKFGGAFSTGATSRVFLINGTMACNVFWIAEGAISMAAATEMKGTLIANNGAISMGAGGMLEGRMLSTTGAVSVYGVTISIANCSILPVRLSSFNVDCNNQHVILKWSTSTETNNNYFTAERSLDGMNWEVIGTIAGNGSSTFPRSYSFVDNTPGKTISYYRLKQTNSNGNYKYGDVIYFEKCRTEDENITTYPNPSRGKFDLLFPGNTNNVSSIEIFGMLGNKVYGSAGFQSKFNLSNQAPGIYFMHIHLRSKTIKQKIILQK